MYGSVPVGHKSLLDYRPLVGDEIVEEIRKLARPLAGARVLHLNITAFDTATADRLAGVVPLMNDCGLHAEWQIVRGSDEFAAANRAMYNALAGDYVEWGVATDEVWLKYNAMNADLFDEKYDFIVIHDPQPAGILTSIVERQGCRPTGKWIWRCHLDLSEAQPTVWHTLHNHVQHYDAAIFSAEDWVMPEFRQHPLAIVPPTIDPLNTRNIDVSPDTVDSMLRRYSIDPSRPIICQVSRFDRWSDPTGAIDVYRQVKREFPDVQLLLVASIVSSESETWPFYERTARYAGEDYDIHLLSSLNAIGPMEINAFQRAASVALQKSVRKGFSPAIAEASWKGRPVVAGLTGGMHLQVLDRQTGFLAASTEQASDYIIQLLNDPSLARSIGQTAHEHVKQNFLVTRCLHEYLALFNALAGSWQEES